MVLYRKYRPQKLSDLVGQEHVVTTLLGQLKTGSVSHAYLFAGPKGTGKTTTARILAKAVNCLNVHSKTKTVNRQPSTVNRFSEPCNQCDSCLAILKDRHLDVIEIDAASNRGIDDVRALREAIKLAPVMGKYKVYIIDETHMLTKEAANALLKTLEEPPEHAIFILATTAPEKMPETILSRCSQFNFFLATNKHIVENLRKIVKAEGKNHISEDILTQIATKSGGSYRDSVVLLEKILAQSTLDEKTLSSLLAGVDFQTLAQIVAQLADKNAKAAILTINNLVAQGVSVQAVNREMVQFLRNLLFVKVGVEEEIEISFEDLNVLKELAGKFTQAEIFKILKLFEAAAYQKDSPVAQLPTELAIAQFCLPKD